MTKGEQFGVICEQGDMGLHFNPVEEKDWYRLQENREANNKDKKTEEIHGRR